MVAAHLTEDRLADLSGILAHGKHGDAHRCQGIVWQAGSQEVGTRRRPEAVNERDIFCMEAWDRVKMSFDVLTEYAPAGIEEILQYIHVEDLDIVEQDNQAGNSRVSKNVISKDRTRRGRRYRFHV